MHALDVLVERRVIMLGKDGWADSPSTRSYHAYAEQIRKDLLRELDVGTRKF